MEKYIISRFLKVFRRNKIVAFYHSTNMELVFIDEKTAERILELFKYPNNPRNCDFWVSENVTSQEVISHLIATQLLVPEDYDEISALRRKTKDFQEERFIRVMYLILTDDCNLGCTYCFQNKCELPNFRSVKMSKNVCRAALDLLARLNQKYPIGPERRLTIELYGGEPLLNFPTLVEATLYTEQLIQEGLLPANTELSMVTNGTLLTQEVANFLIKHEISVGVSIDGYEEVHNAHRIFKNRKGTFRRAAAAYRMLLSAGAKVGLSCTLTPLVIEHFSKILDFFEYELGLREGLAFNILHYNPRFPVNESYYEKAAECLLQSFSRFRDKGIWEERMIRKARSFATKRVMFADCAAIGHQLVISPDGQIGICPDFVKTRRYFSSSVFNESFDPYQDKDFQEWLKRSPLNMPQCLDCEAMAICGGGCPASAEAQHGSIWEIDRRICSHSKKALEWLIWDQYSQMQKG